MRKIEFNSEYPEYKQLITQFIGTINPLFHSDNESVVNAIMEVLIGSRNIRLGPAPTVESQFHMREVIRKCIEMGRPIPILIPSGPKKTISGVSIDIAELSMLNILNCVDTEIRKHHPQGTQMVLRLEDFTGKVLEPDFTDDMEVYIEDLRKLIEVLDYTFIEGWRESFSDVSEEEFVTASNVYADLFYSYIKSRTNVDPSKWESIPAYQKLAEAGWKGLVKPETVGEYITKYIRLYPENSGEENLMLMCKYFGASLARKAMNLLGTYGRWSETGFLSISFIQPNLENFHSTRFYYRTVELKNSKKAIPFWRAKGYLKIREDNQIRMSTMTFREAQQQEFFKGYISISDGKKTVNIQCDYILEE